MNTPDPKEIPSKEEEEEYDNNTSLCWFDESN